MARLQFDEGAGRLAPFVVGPRDDRGELHGGVLEQRVLDLDRGDVLAAGNDDVLRAVAQLDVAVGMFDAEIAGMKPAAREGLVGRGFVLQIALHHDIAAEHHLAHRLAVGGHAFHRLRVDDVERLERVIAHALARFQLRLRRAVERVPFRSSSR